MKKPATRRAMLRFGLRVLEEREARNITQEQLAERVDLSPRQIQRVEAGEANIGLETVLALAFPLSVEPQSLFTSPNTTTSRRAGRPLKRQS